MCSRAVATLILTSLSLSTRAAPYRHPAGSLANKHAHRQPFFKLKALLGKAAARNLPGLWRAIAERLTKFTSSKCRNVFATAGYDPD